MPGSILAYIITHAILEVPYIVTYGQQYLQMMRNLARDPAPPQNQLLYTAVAYAIFGITTYFLVFRETLQGTVPLTNSLFKAALYAAAVYGVFNLTNMVAFKGYDAWVAIRDMLYGIFSMASLAAVAFYLRKKPILPVN